MTNTQRRRNGAVAFKAYADRMKLDAIERKQDYSITDCITDLLHYARARKHDTNSILRSADNHFSAETLAVEHCAVCGAGISMAELEEGTLVSKSGNKFYCSAKCEEKNA